ncbi:hypothetical protein BGZ83_009915 [Gryganskiella cystojenkinii]|nr:hypothetical protein BGZ83_009915 [Gryganskiella cystojenkinii]
MSQPTSPSPSLSTPPFVRPKVLIVGAGLGGLTLALLLEKAGVPYLVLERTMAIKPLGSALALSSSVGPIFEQLGIYEDFVNIGIKNRIGVVRDENAKLDYKVDFTPCETLGGYEARIVSRPAIHNMFFSRVPREKIMFNKRILSIQYVQNGRVQVICSDNSEYEGDIIVGADGANSSIRQNIYKTLKEKSCLPPSDDAGLPYSYVCLVGQTPPLDTERFPELNEEICQFNTMCGIGKKFTWVTFTTKYKTICWMVVQHLDKETKKEHDTFKTSEWGDEAVDKMCSEVQDFAVPNGPTGTTLGDLIDLTAKQLISKVTLEEKVFKTWFSGRAVLLGDACHKTDPAGGLGATTAIHDAICLANWINVLPSLDIAATEKIFQEYYQERYPVAVDAYETSRLLSASNAKNFKGLIARFIRRHMPLWLWMIALRKRVSLRPQASFLPLVESRGTHPPSPQPSLIKTLEILAAQGHSIQTTAKAV